MAQRERKSPESDRKNFLTENQDTFTSGIASNCHMNSPRVWWFGAHLLFLLPVFGDGRTLVSSLWRWRRTGPGATVAAPLSGPADQW